MTEAEIDVIEKKARLPMTHELVAEIRRLRRALVEITQSGMVYSVDLARAALAEPPKGGTR